MGDERKRVIPGEYLASSEEFEAGDNTFCENDETRSAAYGDVEVIEGRMSVGRKGKSVAVPKKDMVLYCLVRRADPNKARVSCIMASEADKNERGAEIDGVLPVTNMSRGYVERVRDAVRVGDILRARILEMRPDGEAEISIMGPEFGVVKAFCCGCRSAMYLKEGIFICNSCQRRERRKAAGVESQESGYERRERRGPPRGGRGGDRPHRSGGFRPGRRGFNRGSGRPYGQQRS